MFDFCFFFHCNQPTAYDIFGEAGLREGQKTKAFVTWAFHSHAILHRYKKGSLYSELRDYTSA